MESKVEKIYEIKAIVQVLKIGWGDDVIKDWSLGIEVELGKLEKVVKELEELEQKLREQDARETQENEEKARIEIKKKFEAKTVEKDSDAGKPKVKLPKPVITKFQGTHLAWQRSWGLFEAEIDRSDIGQVAKFSYLNELLVPRVRAVIDGMPLTVKDTQELRTFLLPIWKAKWSSWIMLTSSA